MKGFGQWTKEDIESASRDEIKAAVASVTDEQLERAFLGMLIRAQRATDAEVQAFNLGKAYGYLTGLGICGRVELADRLQGIYREFTGVAGEAVVDVC